MKTINTIEMYREGLRGAYLSAMDDIEKQLFLKLGLTLKEMLETGEVFLFDKADDEFERKLFERFDSS